MTTLLTVVFLLTNVVHADAVGALLANIGIHGKGGFLVHEATPDGPASASGLTRSDLLTEFDGTAFDSIRGPEGLYLYHGPQGKGSELALIGFLRERIGQIIEVGYLRKEDWGNCEPLFSERSAPVEVTAHELAADRPTIGVMGAPRFLVTEVATGSRARRLGVQPGDIITELNRRPYGAKTDDDWTQLTIRLQRCSDNNGSPVLRSVYLEE